MLPKQYTKAVTLQIRGTVHQQNHSTVNTDKDAKLEFRSNNSTVQPIIPEIQKRRTVIRRTTHFLVRKENQKYRRQK